jgi:hypothetical protein
MAVNSLGELPVLSQISAAAPYLSAALHILRTLEREIRAIASTPGSKEAIAAEALRTRSTELAAQIARLEIEARTARLEQQLAVPVRTVQRPGGSTATQPDDGSASSVGAVVATLRAKVAQAEKDAKAYKARIRSVETLERSKADLSDKVEALETRLLASEGAAAAHEATLEEMRRRAVVAEAKAEALKKELKRDIRDVAQERHSQAEVLRRVSELEGELQRALLGRATMERRAEVCEAELVESLAKLYTLEREKQGGAAGGAARVGTSAVPLTEENLRLVDACLEEATRAVTESAVAPSKRGEAPWRAKAWLDTLALGGLMADVLLRQLRMRLDATEPLERAFLVSVKQRGGRRLLRSLLLEADVVEQLSERLWMALQALPDANDGGGGGVAPFAPQTLQYQGFEQQHMRQPQQRF